MSVVHLVADTFDRFCIVIDAIVRWIIAFLIVAIFGLLMLQIILRYFVGIPLFWTQELTGYMFVYLAMIGASSCLRTDEHVRVPLLMDALPSLARRTLFLFVQLVIIFYAYHLVVFGYMFAQLGAGELSASTYFILFWPRMALVVGGILIALQASSLILRELAGRNPAPQPHG